MSLFEELRRRRAFRTAALYVVAAWIVLQVADLALPALNIPEQAIRYVWLATILGFPVAMLFGWRYQVTENGIVRTLPAAAGEKANMRLRVTDFLLLGALAAVAVAIAYHAVEIRADWLPWVARPHAYGGALEAIRDEPRFRAMVDELGIDFPE